MKLKLLIFNLLLPIALLANQDSLPGKKLQWGLAICPETVLIFQNGYGYTSLGAGTSSSGVGFGVGLGAQGRLFFNKKLALRFGAQYAFRQSVQKVRYIFETDILNGNYGGSPGKRMYRNISLDLPTMLEWHFNKKFFISLGLNPEFQINRRFRLIIDSPSDPIAVGDTGWNNTNSKIAEPNFSALFSAGFKFSKSENLLWEIGPTIRHSFAKVSNDDLEFEYEQNSFGLRGSLFFK